MGAENALDRGATDRRRSRDLSLRWLLLLCGLSLAFGFCRRVLIGWDVPLWLDEVFTGIIATRPDFSGLLYDILMELGAPVYYTLMWAWEKLAGSSNFALRLPSLIFSVAASALVLWRGPGGLRMRLVWATLLALWVPGLDQAKDARPYMLIFFLSTAQLILLVRLIEQAGRGRAMAWAVVSALAILSHYHALVVTGLQGLAFLAVHRQQALRTWPAGWPFVLTFAWMFFHIPLHLRFVDPGVAWQTVLTVDQIRVTPHLLFHGDRLATLLVAAVGATIAFELYRWQRGEAAPYRRAHLLAAGCSLIGFLVIYGVGFVRPSFTPRYIVPFMPGILFGLAIWADRWAARATWVPHALVLWFLLVSAIHAVPRVINSKSDWRWVHQWETAMPFLKQNGGKRLLFFWDSRTTAIAEDSGMSRVGGFFLQREGDPMPVSSLIMAGRPGPVNPNDALIARTPLPGDAFIWKYDVSFPGTKAEQFPPDHQRLLANYRCHDEVERIQRDRNPNWRGPSKMATLICVRTR